MKNCKRATNRALSSLSVTPLRVAALLLITVPRIGTGDEIRIPNLVLPGTAPCAAPAADVRLPILDSDGRPRFLPLADAKAHLVDLDPGNRNGCEAIVPYGPNTGEIAGVYVKRDTYFRRVERLHNARFRLFRDATNAVVLFVPPPQGKYYGWHLLEYRGGETMHERLEGESFNLRERARVMRDAGQLEEAIAEYRRALALLPVDYVAMVELADVAFDAGDLGLAVTMARRVLALPSAEDFPWGATANERAAAAFSLGRVYERLHDLRRALELYRQADELNPSGSTSAAITRLESRIVGDRENPLLKQPARMPFALMFERADMEVAEFGNSTTYLLGGDLAGADIRAIAEAGDVLWLGTSAGLLRLDTAGQRLDRVRGPAKEADAAVAFAAAVSRYVAVRFDGKRETGSYWLDVERQRWVPAGANFLAGTWHDGMFWYTATGDFGLLDPRSNAATSLMKPHGWRALSGKRLVDAVWSRDALWIAVEKPSDVGKLAVERGGVAVHPPDSNWLGMMREENGLRHSSVSSIAADSEEVWAGHWNPRDPLGGASVYSHAEGTWRTIDRTPDGKPLRPIKLALTARHTLVIDPDGRLLTFNRMQKRFDNSNPLQLPPNIAVEAIAGRTDGAWIAYSRYSETGRRIESGVTYARDPLPWITAGQRRALREWLLPLALAVALLSACLIAQRISTKARWIMGGVLFLLPLTLLAVVLFTRPHDRGADKDEQLSQRLERLLPAFRYSGLELHDVRVASETPGEIVLEVDYRYDGVFWDELQIAGQPLRDGNLFETLGRPGILRSGKGTTVVSIRLPPYGPSRLCTDAIALYTYAPYSSYFTVEVRALAQHWQRDTGLAARIREFLEGCR